MDNLGVPLFSETSTLNPSIGVLLSSIYLLFEDRFQNYLKPTIQMHDPILIQMLYVVEYVPIHFPLNAAIFHLM